jgi:tungstate transport system ATP-binding protein
MMTILEAIDIFQKYEGRTVLRNINVKFTKGDIFALIGPTGAGKTTLLRILDLIESPFSGKLLFDGLDVIEKKNHNLEARRRMSYVFQKPIVFNMSVFDNIASGLKWRREERHDIQRKVVDALQLVGMTDYRNRNAKTLSGGETQLVALARALVTNPDILFLDEPTANVDPVSTQKIETALTNYIKTNKTTVIMSTHDMSQGHRLANRVGVIINGELMQIGDPNSIFNEPNSREVAEFVGTQNILEGTVSRREDGRTFITVGDNEICTVTDCAVGDDVYVLIRPEAVLFTREKENTSARNVLRCRVTRINTIGQIVRIEVECGFPLIGVVTEQAAQELSIAIGKEIYAMVKATAIYVIPRSV